MWTTKTETEETLASPGSQRLSSCYTNIKQRCHAVWTSDRPPTNIYVHSRLVNENSHASRHVLVIKESCLISSPSCYRHEKRGVNEIISSSSTKTTLLLDITKGKHFCNGAERDWLDVGQNFFCTEPFETSHFFTLNFLKHWRKKCQGQKKKSVLEMWWLLKFRVWFGCKKNKKIKNQCEKFDLKKFSA